VDLGLQKLNADQRFTVDTANCRMQKQWDKREELLPGNAAAYGRFERETTKSTPKDKRP